jgi:predicted amidohydrolase
VTSNKTINMKDIRIAAAQFETRSGDKKYNFSRIEELTSRAAGQGAQAIAFHELCIPAYTFLKDLDKEEMLSLAEEVPQGESTSRLIQIAARYKIAVLAGLLEKEGEKLYNTYVCVTGEGMLARFRKLHPFISQYLSAGNAYVTFDLCGCKCGILICYDNNIIENVRATALLGAEILFAPHVTCCTPSSMPGRGWVDKKLWDNRRDDPQTLRNEFDGLKGRGWLMRWLPARAYDNGIYLVFSNPIGMEGDQVKNGNSMIFDPYGEIIAECRSFDDEVVVATCTAAKLELAGGFRYRKARRPELYGHIIGKPHDSSTKVDWM